MWQTKRKAVINYRFDMRIQYRNIYKFRSTCKEWIEKAFDVFRCKVMETADEGEIEIRGDD